MNRAAAERILGDWLARFRAEAYASLAARIDQPPVTAWIETGDGSYQLELQCFWDDQPDGHVRVMASIDDGGWRAFVPLTRDFIKAPDGRFIGE
jgi:hypothetical protein